MEDTKKTAFPKKLTDFQEEMISVLTKLVDTLEDNTKLLRENAEIKERVIRLELETYNTLQVPPIQNGTLKIVEVPTK
jgi:hypothetical protein